MKNDYQKKKKNEKISCVVGCVLSELRTWCLHRGLAEKRARDREREDEKFSDTNLVNQHQRTLSTSLSLQSAIC